MSSLPFSNSASSTSDVLGKSGEAFDDGVVAPTPPQISSPSICSPSPLSGADVDVSLHEKLDTLYSPPQTSLPASSSSGASLSNDTTEAVAVADGDGVSGEMKHCKRVVGNSRDSDHKSASDFGKATTGQVKGSNVSVQLPENRSRDTRRYNVVIEVPSSTSSKTSDGCTPSVKRMDLMDSESDCIGYCSVCLVRPSNCVFLPCGHIKTCIKCGSNLYLRKMKCPVCRKMMKLRPYQVYT